MFLGTAKKLIYLICKIGTTNCDFLDSDKHPNLSNLLNL